MSKVRKFAVVVQTFTTIIALCVGYAVLAYLGDALKDKLPTLVGQEARSMTQVPDSFRRLFTDYPAGSPAMPSRYFSTTKTMLQNVPETALLEVVLDPSVSPVWSIVITALEVPVPPAPSLLVNSAKAIGRLYFSGGQGEGGGGINLSGGQSFSVPFDPTSVVVLTIPASYVKVTIDTTPIRIPGGQRGQGIYSAYAIPQSISRGQGAFFSEWTDVIAPGNTAFAGVASIVPAAAESVMVMPYGSTGGAYTVQIGYGLAEQTWRYAGGPDNSVPGWIPVASLGSKIAVTNDGAAPCQYVAIWRLRI